MMNHDKYHVSDPVDPRFEAKAHLDHGKLVFEIRAELESGERSTVLRAPDQLRKILAYFAPRFDSLRVTWAYGENLKAFNRAVAAGAAKEEAVWQTPLGHQIALAGFGKISIESLEGLPARYVKVVACFRKPSAENG